MSLRLRQEGMVFAQRNNSQLALLTVRNEGAKLVDMLKWVAWQVVPSTRMEWKSTMEMLA